MLECLDGCCDLRFVYVNFSALGLILRIFQIEIVKLPGFNKKQYMTVLGHDIKGPDILDQV